MAIVSLIVSLVFIGFALTTPIISQDCHAEMTNVDTGLLEVSVLQLVGHDTCTWVLSAQPGKTLIATLKSVSLPSDADNLSLTVDTVEHHVPARCRDCLENLVGSVLTINVSLSSNLTEYLSQPDNVFAVRYRSVDFWRCKHPEQPQPYGQTVGKGRKVGDRIRYRCQKQYKLIGRSENFCQAGKGLMTPTWIYDTPSCLLQECGDSPVKLASDTGVIEYSLTTGSLTTPKSCIWEVTVAPEKRIRVQVERLNLPMSDQTVLYIYDGERTPGKELMELSGKQEPVNVSTTANVLTVLFRGGNLSDMDGANDFGFTVRYNSFAKRCRQMGELQSGTVVNGHLRDVGSVVSFKCHNSFLIGKENVTCLSTGKWSGEMPWCVLRGGTELELSEESDNPKESSRHNDTGMVSRNGDGTQGSSRIQKEQVPHHVEDDGAKPSYLEKDLVSNERLDTVDPTGLITEKSSSPQNMDFPWLFVVIGVLAPLAAVILGVIAYLIYRKKYPVRMNLGRRFETFENPVYEMKKKEVPDQLLQDPHELLRLTTN